MSTTKIKIEVAGESNWAVFFIPSGQCSLNGIDEGRARAHLLPVGIEYISRAIEAACVPRKPASEEVDVTPVRGERENSVPTALYEIGNVGTTADYEDEKTPLPVLRLSRPETQAIDLEGFHTRYNLSASEDFGNESSAIEPVTPATNELADNVDAGTLNASDLDVLVHWFGELSDRSKVRENLKKAGPRSAKVHIQVGLASPLGEKKKAVYPADLAKPSVARIIVVNVGELSLGQRIRRSLSYEAIAVDLLRFLRGTGDKAKAGALLEELSMTGNGAAPLSVLAVRLNNSAVFLYACKPDPTEGIKELDARLLCHKKECAPLSLPELEQMVGYTGFVSAQVGAAIAGYLHSKGNSLPNTGSDEQLQEAIIAGVRRSLAWQRINFERGCVHMLFKKSEEHERGRSKWRATLEQEHYESMFDDIVATLKKEYAGKWDKSLSNAGIEKQITQFDEGINCDVLNIPVDIERAVAHRTQWFMARSGLNDEQLKDRFQEIALDWLCKPPRESKLGNSIPIVHIGKAELTDRREIEDYLEIHQALSVYSHAREGKPLSVAVFGSPGSGKSHAVRQVVQHLSESKEHKFKKEPLTFNLGQFKSLDDLPAALHLVRNECLSREIPIVFFDEFDSSFQGQPFGWLKFFLAPMQDGEFYHAGQNYKLSNAVFVFAGGVNRSFEELNGRMRNPGFCEAKGPDFISRLKAHLNVQGINESEDEADQSRYILRRGIFLRGMAKRQLKLKDDDKDHVLFHPSVARALLNIPQFKHGVRSLEAIIKMCATRPAHRIGPSDLPSMDQLEMHVDAMKLLGLVDSYSRNE